MNRDGDWFEVTGRPRRRGRAASAGPVGHSETAASGMDGGGARLWLGIFFRCCHVYGRVYKSYDGACYRGNCPNCGSPLRVGVGDGGTSERFFEAR